MKNLFIYLFLFFLIGCSNSKDSFKGNTNGSFCEDEIVTKYDIIYRCLSQSSVSESCLQKYSVFKKENLHLYCKAEFEDEENNKNMIFIQMADLDFLYNRHQQIITK